MSSFSAVEEALRRLLAATSAPPAPDMPVDQLIAHADVIAKEREPIFRELSVCLAKGARLTPTARELIDALQRSDRAWRAALDNARSRLESSQASLNAPTGRVSAYRRAG